MTSTTPTGQDFAEFFGFYYEDNFDAMEAAVQKHGSCITNARKEYMYTTLMKAVWVNKLKTAELLIGLGADLNLQNKRKRTSLHFAVMQGHKDMTVLLLDAGADHTIKDENGKTALEMTSTKEIRDILDAWVRSPLFGPAAIGDLDCVNRLVAEGTSVNAVTAIGRTALHLAAVNNREAVLQSLIEQGADINAVDQDGNTPLLLAAVKGFEQVSVTLLRRAADSSVKNKDGKAALHVAAEKNYEALVTVLLKNNVDINILDEDGNTPLLLAAAKGFEQVAATLLRRAADSSVKNKDGKAALHVAAEKNYEALVTVLLQHYADINILDEDGNTPLLLAAAKGFEQVAATLLRRAADSSVKNKDGKAALHVAAEKNYEALVTVLLQHYALMDVFDKDGNTPLHLAVSEGFDQVTSRLLQGGSDFTIRNKMGRTVLHVAAAKGREATVALLVDHKADIDGIDNDGNTPLHLAVSEGFDQVTSRLLQGGSDFTIRNKMGRTALHVAAAKGREATVALLVDHKADIDGIDNDARSGSVRSVSLSTNGLKVASGSEDNTVKIWDYETRSCLFTFKGHVGVVSAVSLNADGSKVVTGSNDKTVKIWDAVVGTCLCTCRGHSGGVNSVSLFTDGSRVASGSADSTVKIWNTTTGKCILTLEGHSGGVNSVCLSADGTKLASGSDDRTIKIWDTVTGSCLRTCEGHSDSVRSVCFYTEESKLKIDSGSDDTTVKVWNAEDGSCGYTKAELSGTKSSVLTYLSEDGKRKVYALLEDYKISFGTSWPPTLVEDGHSLPVRCLCLSADGSKLLSGSDDETIRVWDTASRSCTATLEGHSCWDGRTALHIACAESHTDVVLLLLAKGADVLIADKEGITTLHLAAASGLVEVCAKLLQLGADISAVDKTGKTALHFATANKHDELVTLLVDHKADVNVVDKAGKTALHFATANKQDELVTLLVKHDADVNVVDKAGKTALHFATANKQDQLVTLLVEHDADVNVVDKEGVCGLEYLKGQGKQLLIQIKFPMDTLLANHNALWFAIIDVHDVDGIADRIKYYVGKESSLATVKDYKNRSAMDMATPANRDAINSVILIHGRYRIVSGVIHQSKTCLVYEAEDWGELVKNGNPARVALKCMFVKDQYIREIDFRDRFVFDSDLVIAIIRVHNPLAENGQIVSLESCPEEISMELQEGCVLGKKSAEELFILVFPLAERNMFVALKQERFPGRDFVTVRHIIRRLVSCLEHMHKKGVLHADLKPLNIMRFDGHWILIDLDAVCEIGKDAVGSKSSSAYLPPEAICITKDGTVVVVRSEATHKIYGKDCEVLIAHSSFDIWSLGCIMYQLLNKEVLPLFQCGQDDNLPDDKTRLDNLYVLADWSDEVKNRKLSVIEDPVSRNLLSRMLMKDPKKRITLDRVLEHPFMTGKKVIRMVGDEPESDIFISYRVASDAAHAVKLYDLLTAAGVKVWLDMKCLQPGQPWEDGFCKGLLNSRCFVCLMSQEAINNPDPDKPWRNFSKLALDSKCDNVLLEYRLSLELRHLGCLEGILPILIGKPDGPIPASSYASFDFRNDVPVSPDTHVIAVEEKLRHHMDEMALGSPVVPNRTVRSVMDELMAMQGFKVEGDGDKAFANLVAYIKRMLAECVKAKEVSATDSDLKAKLEAIGAELKAAKEVLAARAGGSTESMEIKESSTTAASVLKEMEQENARLSSLLLETRKLLEDSVETVYPPANDLLEEIATLKASLAVKDQVIEEQKQELAGTHLIPGSFAVPSVPGSSLAPARFVPLQTIATQTVPVSDLDGENDRLKSALAELRRELAAKEDVVAAEDSKIAELVSKEAELQAQEQEIATLKLALQAKEQEIGASKLALQAKEFMIGSSSLSEVRRLRSILAEKEAELCSLRALRC